jgi:hypothetical protein
LRSQNLSLEANATRAGFGDRRRRRGLSLAPPLISRTNLASSGAGNGDGGGHYDDYYHFDDDEDDDLRASQSGATCCCCLNLAGTWPAAGRAPHTFDVVVGRLRADEMDVWRGECVMRRLAMIQSAGRASGRRRCIA